MIRNTPTQHLTTLVGSLNTSYDKARFMGRLDSRDIYLLNIIYDIITSCKLMLSLDQYEHITSLYNNLYYTSKNICKTYDTLKVINSDKTFTQNTATASYIKYRMISYWQQNSVTDTIVDIIANLDNIVKQEDTYTAFASGKTITYTNIGRIAFLLNEELSTNYSIYDELGNNVTTLFDVQSLPSKNSVIIVSKNIYSFSDIKFKILKNNG